MPFLAEQRIPTKRRVLLSWIPTTIVAVLCVAVVIGVVAMQNSWWTQEDPVASSDQQASDGSSMLGSGGVDYLTRQGVLRAKVRADAPPASELGLEPDGDTRIEPAVPVDAVVLVDDGVFAVRLVKAFSVTTADDRVTSIQLEQDTTGAWRDVYPKLERVASDWGWTDVQLQQLQTDLVAAAQADDADVYSAKLPQIASRGALAGAEVEVDRASSRVGLTFTISLP